MIYEVRMIVIEFSLKLLWTRFQVKSVKKK